MRILAFGDLHDREYYYSDIEEKIREFKPELVMGVGDIVNYKKLVSHLVGSGIEFDFVFVHGNNDNLEDVKARLRENKFMYYLDSEVQTVKKIKFLGVGGVLGVKSRNFRIKELKKIIEKIEKVDILITHIDPDSRGGHLFREFVWKKEPKYWFHGHKHEKAGEIKRIGKTVVINASCPVITDLEL